MLSEPNVVCTVHPVFVGPCHYVMARPQVADGGMASDMQGVKLGR